MASLTQTTRSMLPIPHHSPIPLPPKSQPSGFSRVLSASNSSTYGFSKRRRNPLACCSTRFSPSNARNQRAALTFPCDVSSISYRKEFHHRLAIRAGADGSHNAISNGSIPSPACEGFFCLASLAFFSGGASNSSTLWIGLKNSDDQGTQFDVRTELYKNGTTLLAGGQTLCITRMATIPFPKVHPLGV